MFFLLSYFIFHVCCVRALVETLSKMLSSFSNINALPVPMLRQVPLDLESDAQASIIVTFSWKLGFWIVIFSCVYCYFASIIVVSSWVYCIFTLKNRWGATRWILCVFEGPDRDILMCLLQFSHGNRNILMCLLTFYPLLGALLVPLGVQIELLPCVYYTFASEIAISSCVYCIRGLPGIPWWPLGTTLGSLCGPLGSFGHALGALWWHCWWLWAPICSLDASVCVFL